ncbi:MAG: PRC-barrel domain-containing protein, partial [Methylocella sp.]
PLARVTASNSLDERSAPIKPTPRRPKSPTVPPQANIFRGAHKQKVYDPSDSKIGEIADVLISKEGRITAVIISVGGFLGMGERTSLHHSRRSPRRREATSGTWS